MKKILNRLKNNLGMTLVEMLVSIALLAILTFVFVPFINGSVKGVLKAIEMHTVLASEKSAVDQGIVTYLEDDVYTFFPVHFVGASEPIVVEGYLIKGSEGTVTATTLVTFVADDVRLIYGDSYIQEGYAGDDGTFVDGLTISIEAEKINFFGDAWWNHAEEKVELISFSDRNGSDVLTYWDKPTMDPVATFTVTNKDHGDINIIAGTYGFDNKHSPYEVVIRLNRGISEGSMYIDYIITIKVSLASFTAVGTQGVEELAIDIADWVYKISRGDSGPINLDRLDPNVKYNDIIWGDSKYVAVGDDGSIWYNQDANDIDKTSSDPTGWVEASYVNYSKSQSLEFVKYYDGQFIAGGANSTILTSSDGITWTLVTMTGVNDSVDITGLAYDGTTYIATCVKEGTDNAGIITTTDLAIWELTKDIVIGFNGAMDIEHIGDRFIAVGADGEIIESTNSGVTWTLTQIDDAGLAFTSIAVNEPYGTGVLVGENGMIYSYTHEGVIYNKESSGVTTNLNDVEFTRGYYIAVGDAETIIYSESGLNWNTKSEISITSDGSLPVYDLHAVIGKGF